MLYPKSFTHKFAGSAAFATSSGLITRSDGTLFTDWTRDGAHAQASHSGSASIKVSNSAHAALTLAAAF
jgi:hypothetical protein